MASQAFPTFKLPDRELIAALRSIADQVALEQITFNLQVTKDSTNVSFKADEFETNDFLKQVLASESAILWRASVKGGAQNQYSVTVQREAAFDQANVSFPDQTPGDTLRFLALVHTYLHAYGRTAATDEVLGKEMSDFYAQRDLILTRLESLNARILESNEAYRVRLESETSITRSKLQQEYDSRSQQLDIETRRRQEVLDTRDADLKQRELDFDNRSSTHARRQIRQDVKKIIAERTESFHLSRDTTRKRLPIHVLFLTLIVSSGSLFLAALLGNLALPASLPSWFAAVRLPLITAALAAAIVFYIRWTDNWFRQHADEEMRLKRLELDIDRASWVVEMALEWKAEKGGEIPTELIDRLSRHLFETEPSHRVRHPSEDLALALLGASAGVSLKLPGGGEAKIDRKGLNEFRKAAQDRDS